MKKLFIPFIVLGLATALSAHAADPAPAKAMDVDQADGLDFTDFHKDKKEAIKVWSTDKKSQTVKTYDQTPANAAAVTPPDSATGAAPAIAPVAAAPAAGKALIEPAAKGQRYEIRERYTLTRSVKTPYSAFYVIEPLYKQAAQLCPRGWRKLTERSEPVEQDYYLYYELECL